ncbi:ABC transporter B family member 20 [Dichanthelium oligosanthes]|uniref:ABC transporter B family member 20 n=1 Tax=Dichanthelium oligosanthes TaxID=888268 RepID=A0A1E5UIY9_9POAL|nr:ABC transporter B family member 20 [Dichanthelium oligosanthes]
MVPTGLFGWSSPHVQPLTPVSEVSEPPESPSPYGDGPAGDAGVGAREGEGAGAGEEEVEEDEVEPPPAAVSFWRLFEFADGVDWALMAVGALAAAAHGAALVVYLHYFGRALDLLDSERAGSALNGQSHELLHRFKEDGLVSNSLLFKVQFPSTQTHIPDYFSSAEVSCWILTGERQTAVIRSKYVQVLLNQDMSFFDTYGNNGDIVSQVLSDVLLIQSAISEKVGNYIHNMATFVGGLIVGLLNCWQIALLTLATGPLIVAAGGISNIFLHRLAENIQDAYAEAASIAEQAISYIRTLYSFTNETLAKYSYATSLQATLRYGILISLVQGIGLGFTYGLAICSCALQLWVGRHLIARGKADGGEVVVALFSVILSGLGLNQAATNFYSFEQGRIAAYRLYEMISRSTSSINQEGITLPLVQGNIEFRNVYFSYLSRPEIPILSGFFLTVPARKTVALVGRNGSGKSSIIPLMERFYDPTLGEVLLDGENIKNLKVEWLRSQIGLVTQEPALLSLSIRENIAYGRSATFDQIEEAAKTAHAHGFISSLEKGYETQVGRAGIALTDEQKIKISIARAVLSNPSILLLDEVTGGLDFEAEKAVQEALDVLMLGRSTIIIARRLSLIKNADYIAVMEEGHLVEMGTHDELLNLDGLYAELLRCEEATKLPKRMPTKNSRERTIGAAIFGSFNPLLAYTIALIVSAYYRLEIRDMHHEVNRWCLFIVGMGVITVLVNWLQHFYFGIMGEKMTERIRRMMFSAMLRNEVGWFDKEENNADTLSMRLANDATFVRAAFSNRLSIFIQDTAAVSVALLIGMLLGWRVALVALATLPVLVVSAIAQVIKSSLFVCYELKKIVPYMTPISNKNLNISVSLSDIETLYIAELAKLWLAGFSRGIQEMHRKASLVLEDAVRNIYTVVAFCAGNKIMDLYRLHLGNILKQSLVQGLAIGFGFGLSQFLLFACNALLLWYIAISVDHQRLTIATGLKEYILFSFASFALVEPFGLAPYILKRRKSLTSVFEIIDREPKIDPDDTTGLKPPNVYGSIEFKNVDFSYPARPEILVLSNFNLKVSGGQTLAVVGVSGSGKSTIISLIERFYDPVSGQVLLDGRDLKSFNLRWLRSHMGLIQQEPVIFSTTIRENIIYARHNATEAEIKEAARIANAHHFISSLPHGYDTHVGMRGVDLTPGQKQRIAIARVVLKNAPILLLDEASSAIESESSRVVQEALDTLVMGNKTTILIAHRAAMMKHVDNIVVLNGGRIVEQGTHDSLMDQNGLYVRLMQPHFGKGLRQHRLM